MDNNQFQHEGDLNSQLEITDSAAIHRDGNQSWHEVIQKNLFHGWKNTLLTILAAIISFFVLYQGADFALSSDWDVVYHHFRLLMIGQYPLGEIWRLWLLLSTLSALIGLSWGLWKGAGKNVAFTFGGVYLFFILCAIPGWIEWQSAGQLGLSIGLLLIGYVLGTKIKALVLPTLILWALYLPLAFGLLLGFGGILDPVRPQDWGGFLLTVILTSFAIVGCFPLGILLALGRRSNLPAVKWFCVFYIELIRGMPLIMVLFIGQVFIPLFLGGVTIANVFRAMWAYTFFAAAYTAENIRGGLQSIPSGQYEAAQALGLNQTKLTALIILPQAIKAVIPALVGQFITIFKDTSLVAIIGLADFLYSARRISNNPEYLGRYMELYVFVAAFYFIFCYLMAYVSRYIERSLSKGAEK